MTGKTHLEPTDGELRALRNRLNPDDPEARVIWDYFGRLGHLGMTTVVAGDATATAVNEGKRIFVLKIADLVGMSPMNFLRRK